MTRRGLLVYALLAAAWVLVVAWLAADHFRVRRSARAALVNRARDISSTCGVVVRSQRWFGILRKERLESALKDLVKPGELQAIALLNSAGEVVAAAGTPIDTLPRRGLQTEPLWEHQTVTLMNLVDLGTNVTGGAEGTNTVIVVSGDQFRPPFDTNRPPGPPPDFRPPPPDGAHRNADTNHVQGPTTEFRPPPPGGTNQSGAGEPPSGPRRWDRRRGPPRPFWMSEEEYKAIIQKQGVHSFLVVLSTQPVTAACRQDLLLRSIIAILATVSVLGSAILWGSFVKSSDLQIRLVRTSEMTSHLRELSLAAAGLAHETRNPLNIIRGLAQMISTQENAPAETRAKSREIVTEADRVTAQLNEFINYSRPREVRRTPVPLAAVAGEVARALSFDIEEKNIRLQVVDGQLNIEADEQLLRQALFNLILNAIQAVDKGGEIQVTAYRRNGLGAVVEVRDNGPGVAPEHRGEIFKPYFTTNEKGTGLGLAVVQQIVLAHGWEIVCLGNEPRGAVFRISHVKLAAPA
jgi:signal transduction histidine kinase